MRRAAIIGDRRASRTAKIRPAYHSFSRPPPCRLTHITSPRHAPAASRWWHQRPFAIVSADLGFRMSFFGELHRRNVVRVAVAYTVICWLLLQVADVVLEGIGAPEWVMQTLLLLILCWA
jgi:hypothetical protein